MLETAPSGFVNIS